MIPLGDDGGDHETSAVESSISVTLRFVGAPGTVHFRKKRHTLKARHANTHVHLVATIYVPSSSVVSSTGLEYGPKPSEVLAATATS